MSSDVNFPEPTQQELDLQKAQVDALNESSRLNKLLQPLQLEALGIDATFDEQGNIVSLDKQADPNAAARQDIESRLLERERLALSGELPIPGLLSQELADRERITREAFRKNRPGAGGEFDFSKPGQDFFQNRAGIIDASARGSINELDQLTLARALGNQQIAGAELGNSQGLIAPNLALAQGFQQPLGNLFTNRNSRFTAATGNADRTSQLFAAGGQALGSLFGGSFATGGRFA